MLPCGKALEEIQHRQTELMQSAVGELHLGFDADRACDAEPFRALREVGEQFGLAYARLSAEHEGVTLTGANLAQEPVKLLTLRLPSKESHGRLPRWKGPLSSNRIPA